MILKIKELLCKLKQYFCKHKFIEVYRYKTCEYADVVKLRCEKCVKEADVFEMSAQLIEEFKQKLKENNYATRKTSTK